MSFLEVLNFQKQFDNVPVLKDISFTLDKGEVLAIIGSSGSGKTTLLRCMNFLVTPDGGTMKIDGKTIFEANVQASMSENEIRENRLHFGLVFQQFNLFPQYTVMDNLMLAPKLRAKEEASGLPKGERKAFLEGFDRKNEAKAKELLQRVGLSNRADAYPCELSGGQKQRVAIARALMLSPDILCFDEPTSALDPELTGEVLSVIRGLKMNPNDAENPDNGSTMIVVTHEMEFARNVADKVIYMADGLIEEVGTPEEVFGNPKSERLRNFLNKAMD